MHLTHAHNICRLLRNIVLLHYHTQKTSFIFQLAVRMTKLSNTSATSTFASSAELSATQSVLAGCIAGCVTRSFTSPLDVVKIIFQVNSHIPTFQTVSYTSSSVVPCAPRPFAIRNAFHNLYLTEGIQGFWKGNLAGCCRLGPYSGLKFFLFDSLQTKFSQNGTPSNTQRAVFGAFAGMIATMTCYPMEVVRTRMILQSTSSREIHGIAHGLKCIYNAEGLRGLYRGGLSGLVGSIPFEGIQFACYEYCKSYAVQNQWPAWRWKSGNKTSLNSIDYLAIGSISGAVAQTISYPFDSVKKRLQAQNLGTISKKYNGMMDCFDKVIREEGVIALYRGTLPNMLRIAPYAAVMFTTYEEAKKFLISCNQCNN